MFNSPRYYSFVLTKRGTSSRGAVQAPHSRCRNNRIYTFSSYSRYHRTNSSSCNSSSCNNNSSCSSNSCNSSSCNSSSCNNSSCNSSSCNSSSCNSSSCNSSSCNNSSCSNSFHPLQLFKWSNSHQFRDCMNS